MGRIAAHTQEQVYEAADKLAASRQEVTPNALRDLLGRGSYSTFVKHIDAWQKTRQSAPVPVIIEMPESVKAAFSQCWQAAASEAGKEIASICEKTDAEIKATKRSMEEAIAAIEQLEIEVEADASKLETAEADLAAVRITSQQAATNAAACEAALSATADQMQQQIEAQKDELARVHTEAEATRKQHAAEIIRLNADFSRQFAEQASALQSIRGEAERLRGQLAEVNEKLDNTSSRERAMIEAKAGAKAEAARFADQLKDQKARSVEVIGKLENGKQKLEAELSETRKEIRELVSLFGAAKGELEALRTQVVGQTDVIKGFANLAQGDKKTE